LYYFIIPIVSVFQENAKENTRGALLFNPLDPNYYNRLNSNNSQSLDSQCMSLIVRAFCAFLIATPSINIMHYFHRHGHKKDINKYEAGIMNQHPCQKRVLC
jgi:hypothetical protein